MGGVGVQQFFVLVFVVYAISLHTKILRQRRSDAQKGLILLYVLYACLALITVGKPLTIMESQANKKDANCFSLV